MIIKKKDTVLVLSGKDKGKKGEVKSVNPSKNKVVVAGQITSNATIDIESIVREKLKEVDYTDDIYLKFGADTKLEGVDYKDEVKKK